MQYKGVHAQIKYDDRRKTFVGRTLDLRVVLEFKGQSVDALRRQFAQCVSDYLLACKQEGLTPRREFSGRLALRIDPSLHAKVSVLAADKGISINQWVERALAEAVRDDQDE